MTSTSTNYTSEASQTPVTKGHMFNKILLSVLAPADKLTLLELVQRWNVTTGQLDPGVERLCKARNMKNAKNFKGADKYLPGLVTVHRAKGTRNSYSLNTEAIMALEEFEVNTEKYTSQNHPVEESPTGSTHDNHPAVESDPPSGAGYYPLLEQGTTPLLEQGLILQLILHQTHHLYI